MLIVTARRSINSAVCTPITSPINESYISPESSADTAVTMATPQKAGSAHGALIFIDPERSTERLKKIKAISLIHYLMMIKIKQTTYRFKYGQKK